MTHGEGHIEGHYEVHSEGQATLMLMFGIAQRLDGEEVLLYGPRTSSSAEPAR